jgi:hypothetical protein
MDPMQRIVQEMLARMNQRFDAQETAHLARQLEHIKAQTYDVRYPELKARGFIPTDNSAGPGADSITYRQWDRVGMAKLIANYADDLPHVGVHAKEFTQAVKSIGSAYSYSIQDLRRSAMAGSQLDARLAAMARRAIEQRIDDYAFNGDAQVGITGFANNANVPLVVLPNVGAWTTLTPAEIMENMAFLASSIVIATRELYTPDTLLLDNVSFNHIAQTPVDTTNQMTILRAFLANNPYVRNIDQWHRLNTAGAASIHRIVAYQRTPEVLVNNIPQEFEQFPPQARNLCFEIPCHARVGGVEIHYPLAIAYADVAL